MSIKKNRLDYKRVPAVLLAAVFAVGFVFSAAYFSSSVFAEEEGQEGTTETETILPPEDPILPEGGPMLMCVPQPQEITIQAYKVICDNESDLPNWGDGTGPSQITVNTAADYVAANSDNCHLAQDWDFQWGYDGQAQTESGDFIGPAGTGWTTFSPSTVVSLSGSSKIWVRENLKADFIPFAGPAEQQNNVSAEFYCNEDIYNYDNYDYITNLQAGQTYYCVGFNVPTAPSEPICGNGTMEGDEQCDDGNTIDGDGCSAKCTIEVCDPQINLVTNGSFENPIVGASQKWDIFSDSGLGWVAEWVSLIPSDYNGYQRPSVASLELQAGVNGWLPYNDGGSQYAELDSDWDGPSGSLNGEPASVKIYQDVPTIPGKEYNIEFYFSPRPGTDAANNQLGFSWDGDLKDTIIAAGNGANNWTKHSYNFTASDTTTRLLFSDLGNSDSLGTFLDNVSVKCGAEQQECIQEGGSHAVGPGAPSCCNGLTEISCGGPDQSGNCAPECTGAVYCTMCGDDICGLGENKCNCPADCNGGEPSCGDGQCNGNENCETCSQDCGGCSAECEDVVVVSNTDDNILPSGKAVLTWDEHTAWTVVLTDAKWIWKTYEVENPTQDETYVFSKDFNVIGTASAANLKVAADNTFKVWINDSLVGQDLTEFNYNHVTEFDALSYLQSGQNNIKFEIMNMALAGSTAQSNPAGLLYRLEIERSSCEECTDVDQDGYCNDVDCNDENAAVNPGAEENCSNQIDDDCDGLIDAADPDCQQVGCQPRDTQSCQTTQPGICAAGTQTCTELAVWGECIATNSPATEICGNGIDEDCNGSDLTCPIIGPPLIIGGGGPTGGGTSLIIFNEKTFLVLGNYAVVTWETNLPATTRAVYDTVPHTGGDAPNYGYAFSTPENPTKTTSHMAVLTGLVSGQNYYWRAISHASPAEVLGTELNFATAQAECESGATKPCDTGRPGICVSGTQACGQDGFWGSCTSNNSPTAENCSDQADNDCDGKVDSADPDCGGTGAPGCTTYYKDVDKDGFGVSSDSKCLASAEGDYTATQSGDCDDSTGDAKPDNAENCSDQIDNDCDGNADCNDLDCALDPNCGGVAGTEGNGIFGGLLAGVMNAFSGLENMCWPLFLLLVILLALRYMMRKGYKKEDEMSWWILGIVSVATVIIVWLQGNCPLLLIPIALAILWMVLDYWKKRKKTEKSS